MAKDYVKSQYVEFQTRDYYENINNSQYSDEDFEKMYDNHPAKLSSLQCKILGKDVVRSHLWSKWVDEKFRSRYEMFLSESTKVVKQMHDAIMEKFPNLVCTIYTGTADVHNAKRSCMIISGTEDGNYIKATPTLDDTDGNYFNIVLEGDLFGGDNTKRSCSDVELMEFVRCYNSFKEYGEVETVNFCKISNLYENQYSVVFSTHSITLYDVEMMLLYHTLAKDINEKFGTDYEYSQTMIDRLWKHQIFGNIHFAGDFCIRKKSGNWVELYNYYFYLDDNKKPNIKNCGTYGDFYLDELILLLDTLKPYACSNYFADMSKEKMTAMFDKYDKMHIKYDKRPDYFKDLEYVK